MLASPKFTFRTERDPAKTTAGDVHRLTDLELASRLSFFLWSSIPDDRLLDLAARGELSKPDVLEAQVRRMLTDPRAHALTENFAGQWLYLRNLDGMVPNVLAFPDFDDNLRQAFRRETELFFESVLQEDRNVLDLMTANYTFLNERLARHYHVPYVYGSHFRRVTLHGRDALGAARQRQHADGVVAYRPYVAGGARQVGAGESARNAAARAAAERSSFEREQSTRRPRLNDAGAHGRASSQSRMRRVPQVNGPDWAVA